MQLSPSSILVIEPHPILLEGMLVVISSALPGAEVSGSPDFPDALDRIGSRNFDLVITDFRIPGDTVLTFLCELAASGCKAKVLILSDLDELQIGYPSIRAGASGFVPKSAPVSMILDAIRMVLAGHLYCSGSLSRSLMSSRSMGMPKSAGTLLSPRELQILSLIGECLSVSQIAKRLGLAVKTVESHRENIKNKLGHQTSAQVTASAVRWLDIRSATI